MAGQNADALGDAGTLTSLPGPLPSGVVIFTPEGRLQRTDVVVMIDSVRATMPTSLDWADGWLAWYLRRRAPVVDGWGKIQVD